MGSVLSACVQCATYCHDQYHDYQYGDHLSEGTGPEYKYNNGLTSQTFRQQQTSSIFVAVQDKNINEIGRHLQTDTTGQIKSALNSGAESPVHLACRLGYVTVAEYLLQNGCPCDIVTKIGTPIHCLLKAVKANYVNSVVALELMAKLQTAGCDINEVDDKGQTALYQGVFQSDEICVEGLLSLGASPNITDIVNGFTPLHMAAFHFHFGCLDAILNSSQVEINKTDHLGRTSMVIAILNVLEWLQHEPKPNLLYTSECVPDEPVLKQRCNRLAVVEALLTGGADPNTCDSYSRNPMIIAHGLLALEMLRYGHVMGYNSKLSHQQTYSSPEQEIISNKRSKNIQESLFAPMVRLLVLYGARFPEGHQQTSFMEFADWMQKLYEDSIGVGLEGPGQNDAFKNPHKLVHISRMAIRRHLCKVSKLHYLDELPLPENMLRYVQIKYI